MRGLLLTRSVGCRATVVVALLLVGGCADRGVAAGPPSGTSTSTWAAVTVAAVGASVMLAALIVLPAMRPGGSVIASWVLALQAGGAAVAGAVIVGAAVRSEQLLHRPPEAEQAASLLRLSTLDGGDAPFVTVGPFTLGFFTLVGLVTLVFGGLAVALLTVAARCAADDDPVERTIVSGLLILEVAASLGCGVVVGLGFRHLGFVLPAAALPVLVIAAVAAWPRSPALEPGRSG